MDITLIFNLKKKEENKPEDYCSEYDSEKTVLSIAEAIKKGGHQVNLIDAREDLFVYFKNRKTDMVFNIAEGNGTKLRESEVPAILDMLDIPYTGSGVMTMAIALNKSLTKKILRGEGIVTPNSQLFVKGMEKLSPGLNFPLIVKPNREGSAKGILSSSVVNNEARLYEEINKVVKGYKQEALAEEFIEGKELTVGVLANGSVNVLPILEIDFSSCRDTGEYFYSWRMKEYQGDVNLGLIPTFHCPARIDKETEERVKRIALECHEVIGCHDMSRTDIRLTKDNIPYVLEINPLPGLDPDESNFPMMAKAAGITYPEMINSILESAFKRHLKGGKLSERNCPLRTRDAVSTATN
ncbi:MAG: ATP-grasp domain-containing protein [Candidatus Omnitrophota bacterium]|nr:ATP-grasp domain-containing protein [Candidatus Omnitrophota bacterium]